MERIEKVREMRLASTDAGTRKLAETPTVFRETYNPDTFIIVPSASSERRRYVPMGFLGSDTISTNLNLIVPDATRFHFGVMISNVHQLVKIYCEQKTDIVLNQINNLLRPRDYFVLDNLVELVFPQTDPEIDAVEENDEEGEGVAGPEEPKADVQPVKERGRGGIYTVVEDEIPDGCEHMFYAGQKVSASGYYIPETDEFVVLKGLNSAKQKPIPAPQTHGLSDRN